jgi:uncharacterized protein (UPF0332 family)
MGDNPGLLFYFPFIYSSNLPQGYREKSLTCIKYAIESLFVDAGTLDNRLLQDFSYAMKIREVADYGSV